MKGQRRILFYGRAGDDLRRIDRLGIGGCARGRCVCLARIRGLVVARSLPGTSISGHGGRCDGRRLLATNK